MQTRLTRLLIFAVGYFAAVTLSERSYGSLAVPSPFWLPDSVLLTALLLAPKSDWLAYAVALWPIRLAAGAVAGTPLWFLLLAIANDTAKGLASAWLLQRVNRDPIRLETLREFRLFLLVAALLMPALSALAAAPLRAALGNPIWPAAYQWFLGDALTQVVVTPTLLYWFTRHREIRRRWTEMLAVAAGVAVTLLAALTLTHPSYGLSFLYLLMLFLIWAALRLGPLATANCVALVGVVAMIAAVRGTGTFAAEPAGAVVLSIQLSLLVLGTGLLAFAIVAAEREALSARENTVARRFIEAQDHERGVIARQLHDDIGQQLTLLVMSIDQLRHGTGLPEDARREADGVARTAHDLALAVQGLSHKLHPSTIDLMGLEGAIHALERHFSEREDFLVQVHCGALPTNLNPQLSLCAYRVVQEGLHNVVKHSGVSHATVEIDVANGQLTVDVHDTGRGFDTRQLDPRSGLGLVSMRARVRSLGGDLVIDASPHRGTSLRATLPLSPDALAL